MNRKQKRAQQARVEKTQRKEKARTHKAQHYIAQAYSRAWCDPKKAEREEPFVWVIDRDGPTDEKPARRKAPANIFYEQDMYTIRSTEDPLERDLSLEKELSRIEGDFCAVRRDFIEPRKPLGPRERQIICAFVAAQQHRTPGAREHVRTQWTPALNMMKEITQEMESKSPAERAKIAKMYSGGARDRSGLTMEQVQAMVDQPLQTTMAPQVNLLAPALGKLKLSIMCTETTPGFITSDEPCVWFDPESPKRPPLYRAPGLGYPTIEITMPLSPRSLLFLSHHPFPEYFDVDEHDLLEAVIDDINRRTCRCARESVVVSKNEFRPIWTKAGDPPPDAWPDIKGAPTAQDA